MYSLWTTVVIFVVVSNACAVAMHAFVTLKILGYNNLFVIKLNVVIDKMVAVVMLIMVECYTLLIGAIITNTKTIEYH